MKVTWYPVEYCTTSDEDKKGMTLLAEALEAAYTAGRDDAGNYTRNFGNADVVDSQQLWEKVCEVLGVKV